MNRAELTIAHIYAHCDRNPQRIFRYARIVRAIRFMHGARPGK